MANEEARKETMNLYNGCWLKSTPRAAILKSLNRALEASREDAMAAAIRRLEKKTK